MSKYTTEVRFICETLSGLTESAGLSDVETVIETAREQVFDFDYPIFDTEYKSVLETKILKHYYTREIGEETVGLWKLRLNTKLNEIMPYYNKLYTSELLEFNPLYTMNMETTHTGNGSNVGSGSSVDNFTKVGSKESESSNSSVRNVNASDVSVGSDTESYSENGSVDSTTQNTGTSSSQNSSSGSASNAYSDTPQGALTNVASGTYLTNASYDTTSNSASDSGTTTANGSSAVDSESTYDKERNTNNSNVTNTEDSVAGSITGSDTVNETNNGTKNYENSLTTTDQYIEKVVGYNTTNISRLLSEYRDTFLNIDMDIIRDLEPLFMQLW